MNSYYEPTIVDDVISDELIRMCVDTALQNAEARRKEIFEEKGFIKAVSKGKGDDLTCYNGSRQGWVFKTGREGLGY